MLFRNDFSLLMKSVLIATSLLCLFVFFLMLSYLYLNIPLKNSANLRLPRTCSCEQENISVCYNFTAATQRANDPKRVAKPKPKVPKSTAEIRRNFTVKPFSCEWIHHLPPKTLGDKKSINMVSLFLSRLTVSLLL